MTTKESGPQLARSLRLQNSSSSYNPPGQSNPIEINEILCKHNDKICSSQIQQLQDEKLFLTSYVEKLLNQLRQVLLKYGELDRLKLLTTTYTQSNEVEISMDDPLPPWLLSKEYNNSLFQAYELNIQDLESTLQEQKQMLNQYLTRTESLAKENTSLRQEMEAMAEKRVITDSKDNFICEYPKSFAASGDWTTINSSPLNENIVDKSYVKELNERLEILMSENQMLIEQVSLQDDEITNFRTEIEDRDEQLKVMGNNFNQATLTLQQLRQLLSQVTQEKSKCEQTIHLHASKLAQIEANNDKHVELLTRLQNEKVELQQNIELKELHLTQLKKQMAEKHESLTERYQIVLSKLRSLTTALGKKEDIISELEHEQRNTRKELQVVRSDCESMIKVLNDMENQLNEYAVREDSVAALESDCKARIEEIVIEKEQIIAREAHGRREIARLLEKLKEQTSEHVSSQEKILENIARRHDTEMENWERDRKSLESEIAQLRVKMEVCTRDHKEKELLLQEIDHRSKEGVELLQKKLKDIQDRATAAEEARDNSGRREIDAVKKLREKEKELSVARLEHHEQLRKLNDKLVATDREAALSYNQLQELKESNDEKRTKLELLQNELSKVKRDAASRFSHELETLVQQNRDLTARVNELQFAYSQAQKNSLDVTEDLKSEHLRRQNRQDEEIEHMNSQISALKEERTRLDSIRREAESYSANLLSQLNLIKLEVQELKELLKDRDSECEDNERRISELTTQISMALSKQQSWFRTERELRTSVERLTLDKTRMERDLVIWQRKANDYRNAELAGCVQDQIFYGRYYPESTEKQINPIKPDYTKELKIKSVDNPDCQQLL